ncbi:MAG: 4-hydroxy-tetrahydrodipicolinate synthase [Myxococcota bacterium]
MHKSPTLTQGVWTALVTPMHQDGSLDLGVFKNLVAWQIEQGVHGLVVCGTTGEAATLNPAERLRLVEACLEQANGRVPVMAGAGSNDTRQAVQLHEQMGRLGVCATLQATPWYNKPTQEGLYHHFRSLAESSDIPFVAYNVPARTGVDLHPETVLRLARDCPNMLGLKEAHTDAKRCQMLVHELARTRPDMVVLSGEDAFFLPLLALGGHGIISVMSNVAPSRTVALWQAVQRNSQQEARELAYRLTRLADVLFWRTNPIVVKTALHLMGRIQLGFRLPLCPLSGQETEHVRSCLEQEELA